MANLQSFEQYFATSAESINLPSMIIGLILAALMAYILKKLYVKYGTSLSNREKFGSNFILLTTTTTLIITVVKSSLALSLGLVGALSIVRFRAAIKEPEELAFLFLAIAVGLGLGANQFLITIAAFIIISILIFMRYRSSKNDENSSLNMTISSDQPDKINLKNVTEVLRIYCTSVSLKRFDITQEIFEASFFVKFNSYTNLEKAKDDLKKLSKSINITYLDRD